MKLSSLPFGVIFIVGILLPLQASQSIPGKNCLFIGHSFFIPVALELPALTIEGSVEGHQQDVFFKGGANGTPGIFWEDPVMSQGIKNVLQGGEVDIFGMTYHPEGKVTLEDYGKWIDYANEYNEDVKFFLGVPWGRWPWDYTSKGYTLYLDSVNTFMQELVDSLRGRHPDSYFFTIPYGKNAADLKTLFEGDGIPEIENFLAPDPATSLFRDTLGHAGDHLLKTSALTWMSVLYNIDLDTLDYNLGSATDFRAVAKKSIVGDEYAQCCLEETTSIHKAVRESFIGKRRLSTHQLIWRTSTSIIFEHSGKSYSSRGKRIPLYRKTQ